MLVRSVVLALWIIVLLTSTSLLTFVVLTNAARAAAQNEQPKKFDRIVLTEATTVSIRDTIDDASIAKASDELLTKSSKLKPTDVIYIVLDTPGGDVDAGNRFIDLANAIPQQVKTITLRSASMGFHITQALGERLVTPSGTYMSHRIRIGGLSGQVPGEAETRLRDISALAERMDRSVANRMKISFESYRNLIRDEYYVSGKDAVEQNVADRVVLVTCDSTFTGYSEQVVHTLFGDIKLKMHKCPMISGSVD